MQYKTALIIQTGLSHNKICPERTGHGARYFGQLTRVWSKGDGQLKAIFTLLATCKLKHTKKTTHQTLSTTIYQVTKNKNKRQPLALQFIKFHKETSVKFEIYLNLQVSQPWEVWSKFVENMSYRPNRYENGLYRLLDLPVQHDRQKGVRQTPQNTLLVLHSNFPFHAKPEEKMVKTTELLHRQLVAANANGYKWPQLLSRQLR